MHDNTRETPLSIAVVLILAAGAFMQALDASILMTAIPQIANSFSVNAVSLSSSVTVYILATLCILPASAWLADHFGAKRVLICSLLAFTTASVLCGMSQNIPEFLVARLLQGFAGAVLAPVGSTIMMKAAPKAKLIQMVNVFSAPILIAPVLGPPVGGIITTLFGWQWIFYINAPVGLLSAIAAIRFLPSPARRARSLDYVGFILNGASLGLVIWSLDALSQPSHSHLTGYILLSLGVCLAAVALRHARKSAHPLLPMTPVTVSTFSITSILAMPLIRLPLTGLTFAFPIMLQVGFGMSAFASGMLFLAHTAGDLVAKPFGGRLFRLLGYRVAMMACTVGLAVFVMLCCIAQPGVLVTLSVVPLFLAGMARSFLMSGIGTLSYSEIDPGEMANATTINIVISQLCQAVGISLTVIIINLSVLARGGTAGYTLPQDCRTALIVLSVLGIIALLPLSRLASDAGSEISGHNRRTKPAQFKLL